MQPKYDLKNGVSTCDNLKYLNWQLMPCLLLATVFLHDKIQSLFWMAGVFASSILLYFKLKPEQTGGSLLSPACSRM